LWEGGRPVPLVPIENLRFVHGSLLGSQHKISRRLVCEMALRDVWLLLSIIIFSHGLPLVLCQSIGIADVSVSALGYVEIQINKPGFDSVSLIKPKHQYISPVDRLRQIQNRAVTGEVGGAFDFFPDFKGAANSIAPITFTGLLPLSVDLIS